MKVVISYATKNLPWVERTKAAIASDDVEVFIAEYNVRAGEDLGRSIQSAIEECDLLVVLWSKEAQQSKWVRDEVSLACGKKKQIIPLVLDNDRDLPQFIRDTKYIDLSKDPERAFADLKMIVDARVSQQERRALGVILTIIGVLIAAAA